MAAINDLIAQIQDPILRAKIEQEANKLSKQKKFGLVFEEHLPESTRLYGVPIRKGSMVTLKNDKSGQTFVVLRKTGDTAVCLPRDGGETVMHPLRATPAKNRQVSTEACRFLLFHSSLFTFHSSLTKLVD